MVSAAAGNRHFGDATGIDRRRWFERRQMLRLMTTKGLEGDF